jgi:hypothetical protein
MLAAKNVVKGFVALLRMSVHKYSTFTPPCLLTTFKAWYYIFCRMSVDLIGNQTNQT